MSHAEIEKQLTNREMLCPKSGFSPTTSQI